MSYPEMKNRYEIEYPAYEAELKAIDLLTTLLNGKEITIVLGTWCGDSQLQVPRFFKILDQAGVHESSVSIICVDRTKKAEDGSTDNLQIEHVPTFILTENNIEIGRITESPKTSLENDMVIILSNQ